ncbi:MAG TPA: universal stress protein [Polyangiaceae bacterium]|nr:universal stress protein [Polyangiaceae bacterium]
MAHRILAAVDDSPRTPQVLEAALEQARQKNAALRVLHVIAIPPEFPPAAHANGGDLLPAHMRKVAEERLRALLQDVHDVQWEIVLADGHKASRSILEQAAKYQADLIVIGSHGYDAIDRLLGTTAAKVVNLSPIDVLVVHRQRPHG